MEDTPERPAFEVNIKPEHRSDNTRVSWTQYIEFKIYGVEMKLKKGNILTVSNHGRNQLFL